MRKLRAAIWLWWQCFFRYLFPYALVAGIIGGLGVGAYVLSRVFVDAIAFMSTESQAVILAAMATPVVAVLSVVFSHYYSRKREIEAAQRTKKIEFYEEFLHEYFDILSQWKRKKSKTSKDKLPPDFERKILDHAVETARRLILWGGKETIQAYLALREHAFQGTKAGDSDPNILLLFGGLLSSIRNELGHPRQGISKGDLLKLFIKDIDDFLKH